MKSPKTAPVTILAVKNVVATSKLLCTLFDWKSMHGGVEFDILMTLENVPTLMLHEFKAHEHKCFQGIQRKSKGIGQSVYVFVKNLDTVYAKV